MEMMLEYILCGASCVQIGTCLYEQNIECYPRILTEFQDILKNKNYYSLDSFKGKLKVKQQL